jgi:hypothetical protein
MKTPYPGHVPMLYLRLAAGSFQGFAESCKLRGIVTLNARAGAA